MDGTVKYKDTESEKKYKKFRLYKYITLIVLVLFILIGLIAFENDITIENVRYLIKYINFDISFDSFQSDTKIYFDSNSTNKFSTFKGDLVLLNNSGVTLFSPDGSATLSDSFNMANPVVVAGSRYFVVYDLSGFSFRVYNSFSLLYEESLQYKIVAADINDNGDFCILSSEKGFLASAYIYNQSFEKIYKYQSSDKFATDVAIGDNGAFYIALIKNENGEIISDILGINYKNEKVLSDYKSSSVIPLSLCIQKSGIVCLTDKGIIKIRNANLENEYIFENDSLDKFALGESLSAVSANKLLIGVNFELKILNEDLNLINSVDFSSNIFSVKSYGSNIYVLTGNKIYVIVDGKTVKEFELSGDYSDFVIISSNSVILCGDNVATVYNFS